MLRNTVLAFSFSMGAYIIFPIQVVHELSVLAKNISIDQGEFCTVPNIEIADQNDLGIQSNSPKESSITNLETRHTINREVCPTKVLRGKVLHAISQVVSCVKKQNFKIMDGWIQ